MREDSEVYPNAPLQLVAFEARFPVVRKLSSPEAMDAVQSKLDTLFPIYEPVTQGIITFVPMVPASKELSAGFRLLSRSKMTAATFLQNSLIFETTDYVQYAGFRADLEKVLLAFEHATKIPGVERLGLRYIDEIRLPESKLTPKDWIPYISPALLTQLEVGGENLRPSKIEGALQFNPDRSHTVVMRYGTLEGEVVSPKGSLRLRPKLHGGSFFLMDIDSFWLPEDGLQDFSVDTTLKLCDGLRKPMRELFEDSITHRLRNDVFRKERK